MIFHIGIRKNIGNMLFVSQDDLKTLTGFAHAKLQIQQLRAMGIPFFINGAGRAIVTVAAVEGRRPIAEKQSKNIEWEPAVLKVASAKLKAA